MLDHIDQTWQAWNLLKAGGGGKGTSVYKLDMYVQRQRVWFSSRCSLKQGTGFDHFGLNQGETRPFWSGIAFWFLEKKLLLINIGSLKPFSNVYAYRIISWAGLK